MTGSDELRLDHLREARLGLDEAIFCQPKAAAQLRRIVEMLREKGRPALLTRLAAEQYRALERWGSELDYDEVSRTAFLGHPRPLEPRVRVAVVTAGTSDAPVAREAIRTLRYYGQGAESIYDVGVAGLWRALEHVDALATKPVVIVAAGMDAALPSVLGGLLPGAVIAVPTSAGYGAADHGETALRSALCSCAPGVVVVNIDNGFGAACAALRILRARASG